MVNLKYERNPLYSQDKYCILGVMGINSIILKYKNTKKKQSQSIFCFLSLN